MACIGMAWVAMPPKTYRDPSVTPKIQIYVKAKKWTICNKKIRGFGIC